MHVLAKFSEDNCWYRGHILTATKDKDKFEISYLDYGNTELLPSGRLRQTKQSLCVLPGQCVKCRVEGAQYYEYTSPLRGSAASSSTESLYEVPLSVVA